jgi:hypothetical protein
MQSSKCVDFNKAVYLFVVFLLKYVLWINES